MIRLTVYVAAIAMLLVVRGGVGWQRLRDILGGQDAVPSLVVAGRDLAPGLVDVLADGYRSDYPDLAVIVLGGGTNQALEDLINRRADVAFMYRMPTEDERQLFRDADGDTATVLPVALGGIVLLAPAGVESPATTRGELIARFSRGGPGIPPALYAPDPNDGLWAAFRRALDPDAPAADG
ncbi:substrate-binding domain-containing protein, partial [bacterium]|nr:substrate-binding domain-containing protein [bacterium]